MARGLIVIAGMLAAASSASAAVVCPFCDAVARTFTEELKATDVVVVAKLTEPPPPPKKDADGFSADVSKAKFEVVEVVRGDSNASPGDVLETIYFGSAPKGSTFLVLGVDPPQLQWSTPMPLSERGRVYVSKILELPEEGKERLLFFQSYLEDSDEMMARDAYDEFARAPYDLIKSVKTHLNREQLLGWIQDKEIPPSRRRLYLTLLGVCGDKSDLPLLEKLMTADDPRARAGLDALVACYLTLAGAEGVPFVEKLFLANKDAAYPDTYSAIMALRFHATEDDRVPRDRILKAFHLLLDRPQVADIIVPDLSRMEDWTVLDKLVVLFKNADAKSSWVRVPVINYVRSCPKPEAKKVLAELEKIDPRAMQRARTFFPFAPGDKQDASDGEEDQQDQKEGADKSGCGHRPWEFARSRYC